MISNDAIEGFNPRNTVAGCFIEHKGKILLLHRANSKHGNNNWGLPGGKQDPDESDEQTVIREVFEETGIRIDPKKLKFVEKSFVRYKEYDFYYAFYKYLLKTQERPKVVLDPNEHCEFRWLAPKDALKVDLIEDGDYCIKKAYGLK